jgi:hypothetical protein
MLVQVLSDPGSRVAHLLGHDIDVQPGLQRERRGGVPAHVQDNARQPDCPGQRGEVLGDVIGRHWRAVLAGEHKIVALVGAERGQPLGGLAAPVCLRQGDGSGIEAGPATLASGRPQRIYASLRLTTRNVRAIRAAARATKIPVSINWNGQNR